MPVLLSSPLASSLLIILLILLAVFHLFILFGLIPYKMVWGGKLKDKPSMIRMESVSIIILLIILAVVLMKAGYLSPILNERSLDIGLWLIGAFFAFNALSNLTANNPWERYGFSLLAVVLSFLAFQLAA